MMNQNSRSKNSSYICFNLFFIFVIHNSLDLAISQSPVQFLPGFEGPLPFELETGYVGVNESEFFYYFVKSEGNPEKDPLLIWFSGGPGCSSFTGFIYEIGPLYFETVKYNGSLPTLVLNPNSWTKIASIIFIDWPVGTGFSYASTPTASQSNDREQFQQAYLFLKKWLIGHPKFISNPFYVGGDSYSGLSVPVISQLIFNGNEADNNDLLVNLQGYLLGNPSTYPEQNNYLISFTHRMGLISEELHSLLVRSCGGEYVNINPNNVECLNNMIAWNECLEGINSAHILEPKCEVLDSIIPKSYDPRRATLDKLHCQHPSSSSYCHRFFNEWRDLMVQDLPSTTQTDCRSHVLSSYWMNDKTIQDALHIRDESMIKKWIRCNTTMPDGWLSVLDSREYHLNLSKKGFPSLIYSGDHDMQVPHISTQAWIKNLNYSIVDEWRSWNVDGQIAGYTRTYSNRMTFATVKGGGHTAPEYKPKECYTMFKRWISNQPL